MGLLLVVIGLVVGGGWLLTSSGPKKVGRRQNAFDEFPADAVGQASRVEWVGASGSLYIVDDWDTATPGVTFWIAQMKTPGFPANLAPGAAFIRYYLAENGERRLDRVFSPGDRASADAVVSVMLNDFEVPMVGSA